MTYINTYPFNGLTYKDLIKISNNMSIEYYNNGNSFNIFYYGGILSEELSTKEKYDIMKMNNITNIDLGILSYIYFLSEVAKQYIDKTENPDSINTYLDLIIKKIYYIVKKSKDKIINIPELLDELDLKFDKNPSYLYYAIDLLEKMQGYQKISNIQGRKRAIEPLEVDLNEYVLKFKNTNNAS